LSLGDRAGAVVRAREQAGAPGASHQTVCDGARVWALAAAAVPEDPQLREQYAARADELVRKATGTGDAGRSVRKLLKDEALDALRGREDYRQLLKEQEAVAPGPDRKLARRSRRDVPRRPGDRL
jgi:hypothetical protein